VDYLLEVCLLSGNGKPLRALPRQLGRIFDEERQALDMWARLCDRF
jgi:hypothetical protein